MKRFGYGQRVKVIDGPLAGRFGTVSRRLIRDESAWVTMDDDLPYELASFHEKEDARHRNVILWPEQCELI